MTAMVMHVYLSSDGEILYGPFYEVVGQYQIYKTNAIIPALDPLITLTIKY